jgi:hypothetical protein
MMPTKYKLIQVVGRKLDPEAKYMFFLDGSTTPYNQVQHFTSEMHRLLGHDNFSVTLTNGEPKKKMQVFEILDEPTTPSNIDTLLAETQKQEVVIREMPRFLPDEEAETPQGNEMVQPEAVYELDMSELSPNEA